MGNHVILNRCLTALAMLFIMLFIITFSIGLPIYCRPFYYLQIEPLGLEETTGHTKQEIRDSYDEVMNYLTLPNKEFGTGVFKCSEEGKSHFDDCKALFDLNGAVLIGSTVGLALIWLLKRLKLFSPARPFGKHFAFTSGCSVLALCGGLIFLVALDFSSAFLVFHRIFFPGKTNWVFNVHRDEIILALPMKFFMNCAVLIAVSMIALSTLAIIIGLVKKKASSIDAKI